MGLVGRIIGIAAGAVFIGGTFLDYLAASSGTFGRLANASFWKLATRVDVVLLILVVAAMACLAIGFAVALRVLAPIAAGFAGVAFGVAFPFEARSFNDFGPGMWVMAIAALTMLVGAVLASVEGRSRQPVGPPPAGASGPAPGQAWGAERQP